MKRIAIVLEIFALLLGAATLAARADQPAPAGFRAEFLAEVDSVGKKLTDLANAVPAEKYSWRPAPGVRSIGEVYVHVAGGNAFLPSFMGVKIPEGFSREMEKTLTDKTKVIEALKKSLDHLRSVGASVPDADLEKKVKIFGGREVTERALMIGMLNHMHEHLGQSIAYARMNGITPPWSETEQPKPPATPPAK